MWNIYPFVITLNTQSIKSQLLEDLVLEKVLLLKKLSNNNLSAKGFRVFMVPEVPTLVVEAGGMILMSKFNIRENQVPKLAYSLPNVY